MCVPFCTWYVCVLCVHIVSLVCLCSIFCSMCVMYVCGICLYVHAVCVRCMCECDVCGLWMFCCTGTFLAQLVKQLFK